MNRETADRAGIRIRHLWWGLRRVAPEDRWQWILAVAEAETIRAELNWPWSPMSSETAWRIVRSIPVLGFWSGFADTWAALARAVDGTARAMDALAASLRETDS